ncbi:MAG: 3-dehydroquinate synthase [Opitutaceae bacterium]
MNAPRTADDALTVSLGERSYPIVFGADLTARIEAEVRSLASEGRRVAVVTDGNVAEAQHAALRWIFGAAPTYVVPPGESSKSLAEFGRILDFLAKSALGRRGALFAFGGGVVGDLAGYAAASYLRGIDYYQVPTTLLAMVDSSVGGKTGINLDAGKNLAGAFHQPRGVFAAAAALQTLPAREFAAGMAEVVKYGLLGDAELFRELERRPLDPSSPDLPGVIRRCCAAKVRIVEGDERELAAQGGRALLNLGHTFGHAIERVAAYGVYLHGEAVAIGLCAAAELSVRLGPFGAAEADRVRRTLAAARLPTRLVRPLGLDALMNATAMDKKVRSGKRRFVTMRKIGEALTRDDVEPDLAAECFRAVGAV